MLTRLQQTISLLAPTLATGSLGSKTNTWTGTKTTVKATVQPLSSKLAVAQYGERSATMKQAFVPLGTACDVNYGVWLDGETLTDPPKWKIAAPPAVWSTHISLVLERRA